MSLLTSPLGIQLKSILIATDFSKASEGPLRHALGIARHYGAKLYLTHVVSSLGFTLAGPESLVLATDSARREAQELERDLLNRGELDGFNHEIVIRQGNVWEELKEVINQERVDLVVVGTHGRRGLGKLLLGSVSEEIFCHAPCPVLTVGPSSFQEAHVESIGVPRPILFPTDFGAASLRALPYAMAFANQRRAKLVLLHVLPSVPVAATSLHWCTASDFAKLQENTRVATLERLEGLIPHIAKLALRPEYVVEFGLQAADVILRTAEVRHVDVIVMGLNRPDHMTLASHFRQTTAYQVVCSAACPVLTTRD